MKVKRFKKVQRYLTFYRNNFGFRAPYHVLIDGTFCHVALKNKINLSEQIPNYLGDKVKLMTTVCAIMETEKLGPSLYGAMLIIKQFPVRKCGHEKKPISAANCLHSLLKESNNDDHYILATQDSLLSDNVRLLPGCPVMYMKVNAINLEKPSAASESHAKAIASGLTEPKDFEVESLKQLKKTVLGEESPTKKKRKGPKGPNPLAVKKKQKKRDTPKACGTELDGQSSTKRTRKRSKTWKLKIPKQMSKLLEQKAE